ncbi:MAG: P-loop containing nucleoside triphosphate hydrolase protein [Monoraphidium minutum]|nr:MAG: P-loop containing nucleoside triphosphate hydrolase protein [Monoraphidium minutum]
MGDLELYKCATAAREVAERRERERRRQHVVLILRFLATHGYGDACERLSAASGVSLSKVDVADNVDLGRVVSEWEDAQEARWGRRPRLTRELAKPSVPGGGAGWRDAPAAAPDGGGGWEGGGGGGGPDGDPCFSGQMAARQRREKAAAAAAAAAESAKASPKAPGSTAPKARGGLPGPQSQHKAGGGGADRCSAGSRDGGGSGGGDAAARGLAGRGAAADQLDAPGADGEPGDAAAGDHTFEVQGRSCGAARQGSGGGGGATAEDGADPDAWDGAAARLLKPLPAALQGEFRDLAGAISRDIYVESPGVGWGDVAGLEGAKRLLQEAVVMPLKYPELFTGVLAPWKGVLLYGPPGTGKTLLAKAVATQCRTTFFNVSASSIVSKWRGDSEKIVRVLFELARHHAPSTIFLDEVDALMGARGGEGEHEASRRMKTELLIQLDGLARRAGERVFVLAATNMPWELDMALLRRLEKRILVPPPCPAARRAMLGALLAGRCGGGAPGGDAPGAPDAAAAPLGGGGGAPPDLEAAAAATEGYSGSDIAVLCKEAAMRPLRRLMALLEPAACGGDGGGGTAAAAAAAAGPPGGGAAGAAAAARLLGPVTAADVAAALAATKPTAGLYAAEYTAFSERFGQLLGPRPAVFRRLCATEPGGRLPAAVRGAAAALEAACGVDDIGAAHRRLTGALQELHGAIVTVDHALGEPPATVAVGAGGTLLVEEARQWLKDAQAYVLHVQAQASALAGADGSGVADAWAYLLAESGRCLGRVSRQMDAGGGGGVTYGSVPQRAGSNGRRLVPVACLPYAGYWAKAVAI